MAMEGGCYCKKIRYSAEGPAMMKGQCHCRECQYISGGSPNVFMAMPVANFKYTQGTPKSFKRSDIPDAVTREFCPDCGTSLATRPTKFPVVILKVGTLDDPKQFKPDMAIYTIDKQDFHQIAPGMPTFERLPG